MFLAEIKVWDLVLYGTNTPPGIDVEGSIPDIKKINDEDIQNNSIDSGTQAKEWKSDAEVCLHCYIYLTIMWFVSNPTINKLFSLVNTTILMTFNICIHLFI